MRIQDDAFPILIAMALAILLPSTGSAQGVLQNGGNNDGAISVAGASDTWTFTAAVGDGILLRVGQLTDPGGNFEPQIRLLSPTNAQLASNTGDLAAEIAVTAATSGTYTVIVSDGNLAHAGDSTNDTGTYRLHLALSPGTFVVPIGDEGGDLNNGATAQGTIDTGDLDMWRFTASAGDGIVVRIGQVTDGGNFEPRIRLYGPTGAQLGDNTGDLAAEITATAASTGTFTVVVGDGNLAHAGDSIGNTGTYRLHLARSPGTFEIPTGDEAGELVNGATQEGTIHVGDLDLWSFDANAGDGIVVRVGQVTDDGNFEPQIRLYGPTGAQLGDNTGDLAAEITATAASTGSFTVVVSDGNLAHAADSIGNTGTYRLHLARSPGTFVVPTGDDGGELVNGATQQGTIHVGDLDLWSFDANAGDGIVVRVGQVTDDGNFEPRIRLYGPTGAQLGDNTGDPAAEVTATAASTGTFTVVVSDGNLARAGDSLGNTGTYRVHLARSPGAFVVPSGDEGGALINGATQQGTIHVGDLDLWSFDADAGDAILVRVGEVTDDGNFQPQIRLYGPTGAQLGGNAAPLAFEIAVTAASTGTFTVVVSDGNLAFAGDSIGNTGSYRLHLAKVPGPFVVGDEGGVGVPAGTYSGSIHTGDLDMWSFCANAGDSIAVHMQETTDDGNFEPLVRLYGPAGNILRSVAGNAAADASIAAPTSGTYTVVVADANLANAGDSLGNTGTYQLTISGNAGCSATSTTTTSTLTTTTSTTTTTRPTTSTTSTTTTTTPTTSTTTTTSTTVTTSTVATTSSTSATTSTRPSTTTTSITSTTTSAPPTTTTIPGSELDCSAAAASPAVLWPPNHKFVEVSVVGVTDRDGHAVSTTISAISQDEVLNGVGEGNTCPDATGLGTATASLRAEREGGSDGRVYHVEFDADDGRGGRCRGTVAVCVPHDQAGSCGDQGPAVDSTGPSCVSACTNGCAVEREVADTVCTGESIPPSLVKRLDSAQQLVSQAVNASSKRKAKSLIRRGIQSLRQAVTIAKKAAKKGTVSSGCAASVAKELTDVKSGANRWLRTP